MTAREMHYDLKQKLNKIDSEQYRNLKVPEIDWKLNEAQRIFISSIAQPRLKSQLGFEINERTIDDIKELVIDQSFANGVVPTVFTPTSYLALLPTNYWYTVNIDIYGTKGDCQNVNLYDSKFRQHDDRAENSIFDVSSFEWRATNYRYIKEGLRVFTDGTFSITKVCFDYIKKPVKIQNAQDYEGGTYMNMDGTFNTGFTNCELSEMVHPEIVDIAVLLIANDLDMSNVNSKRMKIAINNKID